MLVSCWEAKESLLFIGEVLASGGVVFFLCCLGLDVFLGLLGRDNRVRDPKGDEVLLVDVDDEDVLTGGLCTGS